MNEGRLLIHIGVPKSATTSLQFGAFPSHPEIRFLGKPFYDEDFGYEGSLATAELTGSLWKQDDLEFDDDLARRRFEKGIRPRLKSRPLAVLSEEGLSQASAADRSLTAKRLAKLCRDVDCSILLTVREQKSALFSLHQWLYVRRLTDLKFEKWIRWCQSYSSYFGCLNDYPLRQYRYASLVETYVESFGKERVKVLPMEMLAKSPEVFFGDLEDFGKVSRFWGKAGKPAVENRSPGRWGTRYQRLTKLGMRISARLKNQTFQPSEALEDSGLRGGIMRLIGRYDVPMTPMRQTTRDWLDDYYQADNARTVDLTGLNLPAYGYRC